MTLRLPRALLADAQRLATARGMTVGEMVRRYLKSEVNKPPETKEQSAVRLTVPLFEAAKNWTDLVDLLQKAGFTLKPHGTGLALYDAASDRYVCNASKTGFKYRKLVRRYKAKMPGHAHGDKWLKQHDVRPEVCEVLE